MSFGHEIEVMASLPGRRAKRLATNDAQIALVGVAKIRERADGRSVWRQRLKVRMKLPDRYIVVPTDDI